MNDNFVKKNVIIAFIIIIIGFEIF